MPVSRDSRDAPAPAGPAPVGSAGAIRRGPIRRDLAGGLASLDVGDLNYGLRRNILSARDYQRPIALTARRVEASS